MLWDCSETTNSGYLNRRICNSTIPMDGDGTLSTQPTLARRKSCRSPKPMAGCPYSKS
jgi:hypothetical protein